MIQFQKDQVTVFQSCLYKTTSTVINLEKAVIIVDPNWLPNEIEEIATFVNSIVLNKRLYIIYTHSDFDHIIASGAFANATVIASKAFYENPEKENCVAAIRQFDEAYYISRGYTPVYPHVDIIIEQDGQQVEIGGTTVTFFLAPGHTADSLFIILQNEGIFISGDYLSDVEFPFIYSSYEDYISTVEKAQQIILAYSISLHIPGHGSVTEVVEDIQLRVDQSLHYLKQVKETPENLEQFLKHTYPFYESMRATHEENHQKANE